MSPTALSLSLAALFLSQTVLCQAPTPTPSNRFPKVPLADKKFPSPANLPQKVDTDVGLERGTQFGFNICNAGTENQDSNCQTSYLNSLDDFCLWAPPKPNSEVFDTEGEMVAWCTKPGHGTRLIPAGALLGVQFIQTPDYLQVAGFIDQSKINLIVGHFGGEMDPHGADLRGNPMGGVVFSNGWSNGNKGKFIQAVEWHNFMGGDQFCFKVCDPSKPNAAHYCEHRFDRIGCEFNAPNQAQKGVFESCQGENQDFPGTYTVNGVKTTYTQPPEEAGPISTMPYTARMPASSNCQPFDSAKLFAGVATVTGGPTGSLSSSTSAVSTTSKTTLSTPTPSPNPTNSTSTPAPSNNAETLAISGVASLIGIVFSAMFFS